MTEERLTKTIDCLKSAKKDLRIMKREEKDKEDKEFFDSLICAVNACIMRVEYHKEIRR